MHKRFNLIVIFFASIQFLQPVIFTKGIDLFNLSTKVQAETNKSYINKAVKAMNNGEIENAISIINKGLEQKPDYPLNMLSYSLLATIYATSKQYNQSILNYTRAIEAAPDSEPTLAGMYAMRAKQKEDNKDLRGAISDYTIAIEKESGTFDVSKWHNMRAYSKMLIGDNQGAIEDYSFSINLNPSSRDSSGLYLLRGYNKTITKDIKGSCSDLEKAKELGGLTIEQVKEAEESFKCSFYRIPN